MYTAENTVSFHLPNSSTINKDKYNYIQKWNTFHKLKSCWSTLCVQIEESLTLCLSPNKPNHTNANTSLLNPPNSMSQEIPNKDNNQYTQDITKIISDYKNKTKDAQYQLESIYKMTKVNERENELSIKQTEFEKWKNENKILNGIRSKQVKGWEEYQNNILKRDELVLLNEKIKTIKQEIKIKKDYYKVTESKISSQSGIINELNERCKIIKENIEYKKKQVIKENEEYEKNYNKNVDKDEEDDINQINDINKWKEIAKWTEINTKNDEKEYKNVIKAQSTQIERMRDEIKILYLEIKGQEQGRRIHEWKMKEIQRQQNILQTPKSNGIQYNNNNNNNNNNNINIQNFNKSRPYNNKPFEINKFWYEKNVNAEFTKNETWLEIENLKNDIKITIQENEQNFFNRWDTQTQKMLTNGSEEIVNHEEYNY